MLGFDGSPGVWRGRIALCQCRMGGGQKNRARNKPSISIFCFFPGSKPSRLGAFVERVQSNEIILFLFLLILYILGVLNHLVQISARHSHGSAGVTRLSSDSHLGAHGSVLWGSSNHCGILGEPSTLPIRHQFQTLQEGGACDLQPAWLVDMGYKPGGNIALFSTPSAFVSGPGCWKQKLSFPQFVPSNFQHFQHVDFTVNFIASLAMLFSCYPLNSLGFVS